MGTSFGALDGNQDLFQQGAQQLFLVTRGGRGGFPHPSEIGPEGAEALLLGGAQGARPLRLPNGEFALGLVELPQPSLPFGFEPAGDQPILRLHRAIAPLGPFRFVARPFVAALAQWTVAGADRERPGARMSRTGSPHGSPVRYVTSKNSDAQERNRPERCVHVISSRQAHRLHPGDGETGDGPCFVA
jgi:hypothetical protein